MATGSHFILPVPGDRRCNAHRGAGFFGAGAGPYGGETADAAERCPVSTMRFGCPHPGITCDPDIAHRGVAAVDYRAATPRAVAPPRCSPVAVDADPPAQIVRREIGPVQLEGDGSLYPAQRRVHSIGVEVEIRLAAIDRGDLDLGLASEQAVTVHVDVSRRARVTSDLHGATRHSARRWSINDGGPELKLAADRGHARLRSN